MNLGAVPWHDERLVMARARDIWIDETARRAGFASAAGFAQTFALKNYRLDQLYRAAAKELAGSVDDVTVLSKELRESLVRAGVRFDVVTPDLV